MAMTKEQLRALLVKNDLRQIDAAWICGIGVRQMRAFCLGEYPVPQSAELLLRAYDQKKLDAEWLAKYIKKPIG
jgi:hypothetical protein